jgi:phosphoglycerate dehydrogenase-like enzyme
MRPAALADDLFSHERERLAELVALKDGVLTEFDSPESLAVLEKTEILLAGWGSPQLSPQLLDRMPHLQAVLFAGGSAAQILPPDEARRRNIVCADAGEANAQAVAEYAFAMILLVNKRARFAEQLYRRRRTHIDREAELRDTGNYGATVGLVGASRIGRRVASLLVHTDMKVLVYDPYATDADIAELGAQKVELDELMTASDVVSIHAPETTETHHMIGARELDRLRDGGVVVNTARGALIDHDALLPHLRRGRLEAVLDVTSPEPLPADHELWDLENVILTPHIAGATGNELRRMGTSIVDEVTRVVSTVQFHTTTRHASTSIGAATQRQSA